MTHLTPAVPDAVLTVEEYDSRLKELVHRTWQCASKWIPREDQKPTLTWDLKTTTTPSTTSENAVPQSSAAPTVRKVSAPPLFAASPPASSAAVATNTGARGRTLSREGGPTPPQSSHHAAASAHAVPRVTTTPRRSSPPSTINSTAEGKDTRTSVTTVVIVSDEDDVDEGHPSQLAKATDEEADEVSCSPPPRPQQALMTQGPHGRRAPPRAPTAKSEAKKGASGKGRSSRTPPSSSQEARPATGATTITSFFASPAAVGEKRARSPQETRGVKAEEAVVILSSSANEPSCESSVHLVTQPLRPSPSLKRKVGRRQTRSGSQESPSGPALRQTSLEDFLYPS